MRAGELKDRIVIQQFTATQDVTGQPQKTWSDLYTVWAKVAPLSGREYFSAQQVNSEVTHKITIRYIADLDSKMRVKHGAKFYGIEAPTEPERHRKIELLCKEVPGAEID